MDRDKLPAYCRSCRFYVSDAQDCGIGAREDLTDLWVCLQFLYVDVELQRKVDGLKQEMKQRAQARLTDKLARDGLWQEDNDEQEP